MLLAAPSKAGKSYSSLAFALYLASKFDGRLGVIETEHKAINKYIGDTIDGLYVGRVVDGRRVPELPCCYLESYSPTNYTAAIRSAASAGLNPLLIDSLSHAWEGTGGTLDQVDRFDDWKDATPKHREMLEAILSYPGHVFVTARQETKYVVELGTNSKGKEVNIPRKIGLQPIQRKHTEYEFDIVATLDSEHTMSVGGRGFHTWGKVDGAIVPCPRASWIEPVWQWLQEGQPMISKELCDQIVEAAKAVNMPLAAFQAAIQKRGADKLANLSPEAGGDFLAKLRAKKPALDPLQVGVSVNATSIEDPNGPCTPGTQEQIKALAQQAGFDKEALKAIVRKRGVERLVELTQKQAEEIVAKLFGKVTAKGAAQTF